MIKYIKKEAKLAFKKTIIFDFYKGLSYFFKLKSSKIVIKIVEIEVAIAIPTIPKYLERIIFNIIFNTIPMLEFITGVLESLNE